MDSDHSKILEVTACRGRPDQTAHSADEIDLAVEEVYKRTFHVDRGLGHFQQVPRGPDHDDGIARLVCVDGESAGGSEIDITVEDDIAPRLSACSSYRFCPSPAPYKSNPTGIVRAEPAESQPGWCVPLPASWLPQMWRKVASNWRTSPKKSRASLSLANGSTRIARSPLV